MLVIYFSILLFAMIYQIYQKYLLKMIYRKKSSNSNSIFTNPSLFGVNNDKKNLYLMHIQWIIVVWICLPQWIQEINLIIIVILYFIIIQIQLVYLVNLIIIHYFLIIITIIEFLWIIPEKYLKIKILAYLVEIRLFL